MRRSRTSRDTTVTVFVLGRIKFDANRRMLEWDGQERRLSPRESELLRLLCLHCNRTLPRAVALRQIWNDDGYFSSRSMDVFISRLRKHLKVDQNVQILSVPAEGFKLTVDESLTQ
jgi:DNA-binding response OmpR family regulator